MSKPINPVIKTAMRDPWEELGIRYPDGTMDPLNPKDPLERRLSQERPQWAIAQGLTALEELDCHRKYREALVREFGTDDICVLVQTALQGMQRRGEGFPFACGDCDPCLGGRPDQCAVNPSPKLSEEMSWKWAALETALYRADTVVTSAQAFQSAQADAICALLTERKTATNVSKQIQEQLLIEHERLTEAESMLAHLGYDKCPGTGCKCGGYHARMSAKLATPDNWNDGTSAT